MARARRPEPAHAAPDAPAVTVTRRAECLVLLAVLFVAGAVALVVQPVRSVEVTVGLILGVALIVGADAMVGVVCTEAALVVDNRWSRVRVPWGEVAGVEVDVSSLTGRAVLAVVLREGGEVRLDLIRVGVRWRGRRLDVAGRVREAVDAWRTNRPGEVVRERPWGRVALRGAGVVLLAATVVWVAVR